VCSELKVKKNVPEFCQYSWMVFIKFDIWSFTNDSQHSVLLMTN